MENMLVSFFHANLVLLIPRLLVPLYIYILLPDLFPVEKSPVKYFMDEMNKGNSLRSTTTLGSEKERERVYDTIFRLPWRCELVILAFLS